MRRTWWLLGVVLLGGSPAMAQTNPPTAGPDGLLATVFPGAIPMPFDTETGIAWQRRFFTTASLDEVRQYYGRELGEALRAGPMPGTEATSSDMTVDSGVLMTRADVATFVDWGELGPAPPAGVRLEARAATPPARVDEYPAVGPFFAELQAIVQGGQMGISDYTADDLTDVVAQYAHLAWRHYPPTDSVGRHDRRLSADARLYAQCQGAGEAALDEEEAARRMQQLYMEGKFEEAQALTERLLSEGAGEGAWDRWLGCLERLDELGYATLITIDLHPARWDAAERARGGHAGHAGHAGEG